MSIRVVLALLPLLALPTVVLAFVPTTWPRWAFMWLLAGAIFVGCKWLTWATTTHERVPIHRQLGYLLAWPGLDALAFLQTPNSRLPSLGEWMFAAAKTALGIGLIGAVPRLPAGGVCLRGWVGMAGVVFVLHFGLFHVLSVAWRACGVSAAPLMNWPVLATSVSDFWGKRWNRGFRDLTYRFLFRPLTARLGPTLALIAGFLCSGIFHDLVISVPARGGYGGPTAYFLLQACGILIERSPWGRRLGLGRGWRGWAFALVVLVGPVALLFHPPFLRTVVVPFVDWLIGFSHE